MRHAQQSQGVSERRACRVLGQVRSTQQYRPKAPGDETPLVKRMTELATQYGRYGYRRITALMEREGWRVNHKRIERLWRREGLKVPKKQPKRGRLWLNDGSCVRLRPERKDHVWAYDFVHERTHDGRAVRLLTIVDEYTRECLAIDVARRLNSENVLERLAELFVNRGVPDHIRSDNGPEFTSRVVRGWLERVGCEDVVHRARLAVGKRLCGELQRQATRRAAERGDLLHAQGGAELGASLAPQIQPGAATQLVGLSAACTESDVVGAGYATLRRLPQSLASTDSMSYEVAQTLGAGHWVPRRERIEMV